MRSGSGTYTVWRKGTSPRRCGGCLSAITVARLKEQWQAEWEMRQERRLEDLESVIHEAEGAEQIGPLGHLARW